MLDWAGIDIKAVISNMSHMYKKLM
jgi:hypothetical protein